MISTLGSFGELADALRLVQGIDEDTMGRVRGLHVLPLYHVYGLIAGMCLSFFKGIPQVWVKRAKGDLILQSIDEFRCSFTLAVPAIVRMMLEGYRKNPDRYDLSSLFAITIAASPLDSETRKAVENELGAFVLEGWGMTETSPAGTLGGMSGKGAGCIGKPQAKLDVKIVDPDTRGTIVPNKVIKSSGKLKDEYVNARGELAVRGPQVFKGYYKMPEKTEEHFDDDGWFYTGDFVRIDEDKDLWMVERVDDMILTGGENVYPAEVERALLKHPEIADAAVVAAPHKIKGEAPVAFVVQKPGADSTEEEIREFSLKHVATYAHPRRIFFVNELPKSGTLKTQRFKPRRRSKKEASRTAWKQLNWSLIIF